MTKQWEYKTVEIYGLVNDSELNAIGGEGWELCEILIVAEVGARIFYFKREVTPPVGIEN